MLHFVLLSDLKLNFTVKKHDYKNMPALLWTKTMHNITADNSLIT